MSIVCCQVELFNSVVQNGYRVLYLSARAIGQVRLTNPSIHSPIHPLTHPSIHSPIHPLTHPSIHMLTHPSTHPSIHPHAHPSIHSPIHPLTHPLTHRFIHPHAHPLIHLPTAQAGYTKEFLRRIRRGHTALPDGPLFLSPSSLVTAFKKLAQLHIVPLSDSYTVTSIHTTLAYIQSLV